MQLIRYNKSVLYQSYRPPKKSKWPKVLVTLLALIVLGFGGYALLFKKEKPTNQNSSSSSGTSNPEPQKPSLPVIDLQPTVEAWADKQSGTTSVVVIDLANNKTVASVNPDEVFFSASIYKLFVAYVGYQKVADGTYDIDESFLNENTFGECLDEMIRSSSIPCGEAMAQELDSDKIMGKLKDYGFAHTKMSGAYATTSASDVAILLQRLFEKRDLSEEHTNLFLSSMKDQPDKFRRGLPSGFTKSTVYDKVGWNEQLEWHDTAIVTLPNGRSYVVSVLTKSVGSKNIAALGAAIEAKLTE